MPSRNHRAFQWRRWLATIPLLFLTLQLCQEGESLLVLASRNSTNATAARLTNSATNVSHQLQCHANDHEGIKLASFRWEEIGVYFTITAFVIIAGFAKIGFHKLKWLSDKVPESCLLILLGLAMSLIIFFVTQNKQENLDPCKTYFEFPQFSSKTFFMVLLPPIILDSAYSLHDRVFFDNLGTILVFAVVGTIFNTFTIGYTLFGLSEGGLIPHMNLTLIDSLVFSSLISAVDPVAVLAIFQELGINQNLYFLVFGESLLNDGVTVVLYNTMIAFSRMADITVGQSLLAIVSFFTVSFGGITLGVFFGIVTAFVTKWTTSVRVVEPLAILGLAYLSYLTAELFHFSGIICLIVCGLIQAHYGFYNISQKSYTCVKYFTKMASTTSDTIIFMFLGMLLVNVNHTWNTAFVLWSLGLCLLYRFVGVFVLSAITNIYRSKPFGLEEQFICAYGGLRGAVAFSLASTLSEDTQERNTFIFTTLVVILFTVFIQGISIRPLVHLLKIQRKSTFQKNLCEEISATSMDHIMAGIEEVLGHHGDFYLRGMIIYYNEKYFRKWFCAQDCNSKLTKLFEKIALAEHMAHLYGPVAMIEDGAKPYVYYHQTERISDDSLSPIQKDKILFTNTGKRKSTISVLSKERNSVMPETEQPYAGGTRRRRSIRNVMSKMGRVSPPLQDLEDHILRRALRDNRYNRLHYKYNRNLVNDEDQEITNHLNTRTLNAKRISKMASQSFESDDDTWLPGQIGRTRPVTFDELSRSLVLLQRHKKRATLQRQTLSSPIPRSPPGELPLALLLEAQESHIRSKMQDDELDSPPSSPDWMSSTSDRELALQQTDRPTSSGSKNWKQPPEEFPLLETDVDLRRPTSGRTNSHT